MVKQSDQLVDIIDTIPGLLCWTWVSIVGGLVLVTLNAFWMVHTIETTSLDPPRMSESRRKMRMMKLHSAPSTKLYSTSGAAAI